ncbi:MAG: family 78 glycoside hydrolase catalytic domain [Spirochaetales bacterium]|nr:family 78 glycoside hydrolase catalytic domain [Spirochaetales bacterium]
MITITAAKLFCEYAANPIGLDVPEPRFSWVLQSDRRGEMQTAYQILVAGSLANLERGIGDKWDSAKVSSSRSANVVYQGETLSSTEEYYWKVRVWDGDGGEGAYSEPEAFEMGLLHETDWLGTWIQADDEIASPIFRKVFSLGKQIKKARIYLSGLGLYELYLNGEKVGDHVLDPVLTDYRQKVPYVTYDVADMLRNGENAISVMLGNGWYRGLANGRFSFDSSLKMLLQMNVHFSDGTHTTIESDSDWKTVSGPITHNTFQSGEIYDARLESPGWNQTGFDDSTWDRGREASDPKGKLFSQALQPMKVTETREPARSFKSTEGTYLFDFGQLFSGWVLIRVKGRKGDKVTITYSSRCLPDGTIDETGASGPCESDTYILKGDPDGESYEPRFTFHPVHHVQISGPLRDFSVIQVQGRVVHSAIEMNAEFSCSNELFNRIHSIVTWTLRNALKGFPMDCLHREPLGYNEPASVSSVLFTRTYMPRFWSKWLEDIRNNQRPDGSLSDWAPELPDSNRQHDAAQAGNYPALVWYLYEYYDDIRILSNHYSAIVKWIDYLGSISEENIISTGWLGDHMTPGPSPGYEEYTSDEMPPPLIWTGYYYRSAVVASKAAGILGKSKDVSKYAELAESIRETINTGFFDAKKGNYADGAQTANAFSLILGLVPEERVSTVLDNLVREIMETHSGHIHTGHVGTPSVLEVLIKHEESEALFSLASAKTYPGWGYMVEQGATTIWESWGRDWAPDRDGSHKAHRADSMMMWGGIDKFFYHYIAGIGEPAYHGQETTIPGFSEIVIRPHVVGDLTSASARIMTVKGGVASSWRSTKTSLTLDVEIPVNSRARVAIPKLGFSNPVVFMEDTEIFARGSLNNGAVGAIGIIEGIESPYFVEFYVGSGSYSFVLVEG